MVLQRVDSVYDLEWAPGVKYRDVRLRDEIEQSKYVFNSGSEILPGNFGPFHRRLFDEYYELAESLLKARLIWPALEHTLKCSHIFNILDSSNSIGVTERTAYILRVRQLAVGIAKAYVEETASPATQDATGLAEAAGEGRKA
jgi:glycyl-tRNA synthetase alpha chain